MRKLLSILALLALAGCKKAPADMGPVGANTFFCQIDGRDFKPYIAPSSQPFTGPKIKALEAEFLLSRRALVINARDTYNRLTIYARISARQTQGSYILGFAQAPYPFTSNPTDYGSCRVYEPFVSGVTDPNNVPPPVDYYTDATNQGTLVVTRFDSVAHVVEGTFAYTAREAATGKLVHVTNGRFNLSYVQ